MSVATDTVVSHSGPWTIEDVEALPETGNHARYEILTPGVLTVSPAPGTFHQRASRNLANVIAAASRAAGMYFDVLESVNVEIPGQRLTMPDIAVVDGDVANTNPIRYQPSAVRLVVEIVSPGSTTTDRAIKPELYADAQIPFYWRLELHPTPTLFPYALRGNTYQQGAPIVAGAHAQVPGPFTVELDPAELLTL
jgi:Uma2 family endonuclease